MSELKLKHSPTLNTVIMVENTLKGMEKSVIKISDLKRKLPKQVNHNTLRVILSRDAEEVYNYLKKESLKSKKESIILKSINNKVELIKSNFHYGEPISKNLIPKEYKIKYNITNLFWVELSGYWRMLYTLTKSDSEIEIIGFILDIIDHRIYNKKFNYKSK